MVNFNNMIDTADLPSSSRSLVIPSNLHFFFPKLSSLTMVFSLSLSHISRINLTSKMIIKFFNYFIALLKNCRSRLRRTTTILLSNLYRIFPFVLYPGDWPKYFE